MQLLALMISHYLAESKKNLIFRMDSGSIQLQGSQLSYWTSGKGTAILFLHGFCEDHTIWDEFVSPFIKDYMVILPDISGFGKSSLPNQPCSIDFYADCIRAILDAEKVSSCLMIGHSLGGYITLNFATRYGNYLSGFGLFHSTAFEDDEAKKEDRTRVAESVRKYGETSFVKELYKILFAAPYLSSHQQEVEALRKYAAEISSVEGIAQASLAMKDRKDTTEVLKQSKVPVLFLIGKEDKAISLEKTLPLTHLPDRAVICLLDGVGHMGMFEAQEETQKEIFKWLEVCGK